MKFEINRKKWKILVKSEKEVLTKLNENREVKYNYAFGLTLYPEHEIWINDEMCLEQKLQTLAHELTHCWIWSYGFYNVGEVSEEMICDFVSSCHSFITETVDRFKKDLIE